MAGSPSASRRWAWCPRRRPWKRPRASSPPKPRNGAARWLLQARAPSSSLGVARQAQSRELPARLRREENAIGRADVVLGRPPGAAAPHLLARPHLPLLFPPPPPTPLEPRD